MVGISAGEKAMLRPGNTLPLLIQLGFFERF